MLYHLLSPLAPAWGWLDLFRYLTFRAAFAALTAFCLSVALGGWAIERLRRGRIRENTGKTDSAELRALHQAKSETPTMGGLLILGVVLASALLWARLDNVYLLGGLGVLVGLGAVGFADDLIKLKSPARKGLSVRQKMVLVTAVGALAAGVLLARMSRDPGLLVLQLPFMKGLRLDLAWGLGVGFVALVTLVISASANAVNLTDGLDGLAIGCVTLVALTLGVYAYTAGRADYTQYLRLTYVPGAGELAVLASALVGGGLGFLWFNCYPAQVFMGNTGSLPLGGVLGYLAAVSRQELMLAIIGGIFVLEAVSVICQVTSFKLSGRRVLRCAPLHHHFEFAGLAESKVTIRFWIVGCMLALFGVASLRLG